MIVRCIVAGHGGDGPDLFFVQVQCGDEAYTVGDHYQGAEKWASGEGYDGPFVVFDEKDPGGRAMMHLFEWDSASCVDIFGEPVIEGFVYE